MDDKKTPIAKGVTKHFANEKYRLACEEPYLWMQKAQEVRRSADILWNSFVEEVTEFSQGNNNIEHFTGNVALMLYGLAIENLLKAGLAVNGLADPKGKFNKKSHKLHALAIDLDIKLDDKETELVERLQHFVEWAGRYPIPLHQDSLYPRKLIDGSICSLAGISTGDGDNVENIFKKIEAHLPSEDEAIKRYARNFKVKI